MNAIEIGSHFPALEEAALRPQRLQKNGLPWEEEGKELTYTFSGRNAIKLVLEDLAIKKNEPVVYMPSYVCDSMIDPFRESGWQIVFYKVEKKGEHLTYSIDLDTSCDLFFAFSYFGWQSSKLDPFIAHFHHRGIKVLEDVTHRLFSKPNHAPHADYLIASLRKWLAIASGGFVRKEQGKLQRREYLEPVDFSPLRWQAMEEKRVYLETYNEGLKEQFLKQFQETEECFAHYGPSYAMDERSRRLIETMDYEEIRSKRIAHREVLRQELAFLPKEWFMFQDHEPGDCPVFFPLYLPKALRDGLRLHLSKEKIYCPIHWPLRTSRTVGIEERELSLVLDQRYTKEDMVRIARVIKTYMNKQNISDY